MCKSLRPNPHLPKYITQSDYERVFLHAINIILHAVNIMHAIHEVLNKDVKDFKAFIEFQKKSLCFQHYV